MYDLIRFSTLIKQVLKIQKLYSEEAVMLLLGTAAQESAFGLYPCQFNNGPGQGPFQMEKATTKDIWLNYLAFRPSQIVRLHAATGTESYGKDAMLCNLRYAIGMARLHYRRVPEPFPSTQDLFGMACYWKKYWNTSQGKGTVRQYIKHWHKYIGDCKWT
jgi:hypothetical protein